MTGTLEILALAAACFVGSHFALSSLAVRRRLVRALGEGAFRAFYSMVSLATLIWAIAAYADAPARPLWSAGAVLSTMPVVLMFFACLLAVAGMTSRNVTMIGGESLAGEPDAVAGIATITRHPFLWAVALWSAGHIAAKGDGASILFFGCFALLALGGMAHIDYRRQAVMGPDWGPIAMSTSAIPFLAAIQGRHAIDWRGIGWARLAGGLVLYLILPLVHPWIAGVSILPGFLLEIVK